MTTVIYCRISLDRTGEEVAVQRQERECRELAERNGWTVDDVLVDNDTSATSGAPRPAFEQILASPPDRIVCWHTDRLVRVSKDLERVLDLGIPVYTVASGYLDLSNPAGRAVARTVTAWATYEGEQKALRQKSKHEQRRREGGRWWMHKPFGYTLDGEVVPEEADAIRHACADVLAGKAIRQVAREWEARSFRSSRGNVMTPSVVRDILKHPRNAGKVTYQGKIVGDGDWPAIIDELTLYAIRRYLSNPDRVSRPSSRRRGLLSGLLWCQECGGRVHLGRTGRRDYYTCSSKHCVSWPVQFLDDYVSTTVKLVLDDPSWHSAWQMDDSRRSVAQEECERYEKLLDELMEDRISGLITRDEWQNASNKARERLSEARTALEGIQTSPSPPKALTGAYRASRKWESLSVDEQREVIGAVYPKIVLGRSGRTRWKGPDTSQIHLV